MLTVHLLRHFQTPCSAAGRYCGQCDTELTPEGAAMAAALAAFYGRAPIDAVYASPLRRAGASAAPLAAALGQPVTPLPGMEELRYGAWENLLPEEAAAADPVAFAGWRASPAAAAPPGGESGAQVAARAVAAMAAVHAARPSGRCVVVSHKATLRLLLCAWLEIPLSAFRARLAQPWGALTTVTLGGGGAQLVAFNDRSYLPPALRDLV